MFVIAIRPACALLLLALMAAYAPTDAGQQPATNKNVTALGIQWVDTPEGVVVQQIEPKSSAAEFGLQRGDLLISINEQRVISGDTLAASLKTVAPGERLRVQFARGNETLVKTMAMPDARVNMFGAFLQPGAANRIQVGDVTPNSPAEKAGLLKGDAILSMAGQRTGSLADLSAFMARLVASDKSGAEPIELTVQRPREAAPVTLMIERVPTLKPVSNPAAPSGLAVSNPVAPEATVLGIAVGVQGNRVTITKTMERGPVAVAGILPGDVLLSIGKQPIDSFPALTAAVAPFKPGDEVMVEVQRGDKSGQFRVKAIKASPQSTDVVLDAAASTPAGQGPTGAPGQVQTGVQVNVPPGVPSEQADLATLANEIRMLRARVEALEQLLKQQPNQQPDGQRNRRPLP